MDTQCPASNYESVSSLAWGMNLALLWGPLEWIAGHWSALGAIGMDWGPLEWIGGKLNRLGPSACIQAMIFVTTVVVAKKKQKSASLTKTIKHASKNTNKKFWGTKLVVGNAAPTHHNS